MRHCFLCNNQRQTVHNGTVATSDKQTKNINNSKRLNDSLHIQPFTLSHCNFAKKNTSRTRCTVNNVMLSRYKDRLRLHLICFMRIFIKYSDNCVKLSTSGSNRSARHEILSRDASHVGHLFERHMSKH